ncbi:ABC transporter substrate-binding protein [Deinococcus sp. KSM4-11]|uniref:ABC transporter substrate-binding protein n=1 Tax=Deinococcus sp. KSM4-11 TaxID=2568654 RepID=UPI0010A3A906|nr:ABC transporter substrate-binding protein [Deinococcus sp. KSM4-11]THF87897.1 ABC transporter substrate-binding protein [Deinococcus sp. KSM4-11]
MKKALTLTALVSTLLLSTAYAQKTFTVVRPTQWGAQNMNPFAPNDQRLGATASTIYESLFFVNMLDGKVTEVLGTKYAWSKDNRTLTITTRSGAKWTDGTPFTAKDAAFTFNYIKQYPALDLSALWKNGLASAKATNDTTLVLTFNKTNTPIFTDLAGQLIVPEHIWSKITAPITEQNAKPVGTGPFVFDQYSQQAVRVVKNPNYWMKDKPYIDAVVWVATNSNDAAQLKLMKGEADFGYIGLSDPVGGFQKKGANNAFYWPVDNGNYLYFNTTKAPFNDAAFRRGLSQAVNTADVALKAYSGVAKGSHSSGIIPAQLKSWLPAGLSSMKFDPAAADKALTDAGYKKDGNGTRLGKDGKALPTFKILVGAGWTDYITMATTISENLKKVGIATSVDQQQWSSYSGGLQSATYDMGISWGWGNGPTPYLLYYKSFDPDFSAPVGKTAPSNLAHYTNPVITKALETYRSSSDMAVQKKAIGDIAKIVMQDMPFLPLTDRSEFADFNTSKFTGFPSAENPYNYGNPDDSIGARLMYLNVKPK